MELFVLSYVQFYLGILFPSRALAALLSGKMNHLNGRSKIVQAIKEKNGISIHENGIDGSQANKTEIFIRRARVDQAVDLCYRKELT